MSKEQIREVLEKHPDGLTQAQVAARVQVSKTVLYRFFAAHRSHGIYVDRYIVEKGRRDMPVYIAVPMPEDCPEPDKPFAQSIRASVAMKVGARS